MSEGFLIRSEQSYLYVIFVLAGCGVAAILIAAVTITKMHTASMNAKHIEQTRAAGQFYQENGLKILTVSITIFALVALAILGLVKGSEVIGAISAIGGYVLGSANLRIGSEKGKTTPETPPEGTDTPPKSAIDNTHE